MKDNIENENKVDEDLEKIFESKEENIKNENNSKTIESLSFEEIILKIIKEIREGVVEYNELRYKSEIKLKQMIENSNQTEFNQISKIETLELKLRHFISILCILAIIILVLFEIKFDIILPILAMVLGYTLKGNNITEVYFKNKFNIEKNESKKSN